MRAAATYCSHDSALLTPRCEVIHGHTGAVTIVWVSSPGGLECSFFYLSTYVTQIFHWTVSSRDTRSISGFKQSLKTSTGAQHWQPPVHQFTGWKMASKKP